MEQGTIEPGLIVTADKLRPLLTLAEEAKICTAELLSDVGLEPGLAPDTGNGSIALADYFRILEKVATAAHDETWKLSTRPLLPGATTFVLSHLSDCNTLHEAVRRIAEAYNHLHGGAYNRIELKEDFLVYAIDDREFPYSIRSDPAHVQFTMECVLIFLHSMLTLVSTDELSHRVAKVYTRRSKQTTEARCLRFWNTSVRWECDYYALLYDADAASLPVILPDGRPPSLHAIYRKAVALIEDRQRSVHAEPGATERVVEAIGQGLLDQQKVAASMGISVATLRRRLLEEGASFRKVRRQTLNANAKSLLEHRHHVSEVADTLGFSDFRSFNRAFKSWNGVTPCVYAARYLQSRR